MESMLTGLPPWSTPYGTLSIGRMKTEEYPKDQGLKYRGINFKSAQDHEEGRYSNL